MRTEEELAVYDRYGITPAELLFIKMTLSAREPEGRGIAEKYFALHEDVRSPVQELIVSLKDKGVVLSPVPGKIFRPADVRFSKAFETAVYKASFTMGKELYDAYPLSIVVNGVEHKLRRVSKKFDSLEQAFFRYGKSLGWSPVRHARVLELVKAGRESGYVFTTLGDFIVDCDWENLEAMSAEGSLSPATRML